MQIDRAQPFWRAAWLLHFRIENVNICIPNCTSQNHLGQNKDVYKDLAIGCLSQHCLGW